MTVLTPAQNNHTHRAKGPEVTLTKPLAGKGSYSPHFWDLHLAFLLHFHANTFFCRLSVNAVKTLCIISLLLTLITLVIHGYFSNVLTFTVSKICRLFWLLFVLHVDVRRCGGELSCNIKEEESCVTDISNDC